MTRPRWKNPDKRMHRALELRRQGLSLRQIATELAVDERTVRRDLARFAEEHLEIEPSRPQLRIVRQLPAASDPNAARECRTDAAQGRAG